MTNPKTHEQATSKTLHQSNWLIFDDKDNIVFEYKQGYSGNTTEQDKLISKTVLAFNAHADLVEALKELINKCENIQDDYCFDDNNNPEHFQSDELKNVVNKAKQALKKAGEL